MTERHQRVLNGLFISADPRAWGFVGQFKWMSGDAIPPNLDLRRQGWSLLETDAQGEGRILIFQSPIPDDAYWCELLAFTRPEDRRLMVVAGVNGPEARTRLLAAGFGDAVDDLVQLEEFEARARRLADMACWVPRRRTIESLSLDLMVREASYFGKSLNLHPREFTLLWRLAETPNEAVSKRTLVRDIWRLGFMPESNSIAVQMSRLRSKLSAAGLKELIATVPAGYLFNSSMLVPPASPTWSRQMAGSTVASAAAS